MEEVVGWITFKTRIDKRGFKRGLSELSNGGQFQEFTEKISELFNKAGEDITKAISSFKKGLSNFGGTFLKISKTVLGTVGSVVSAVFKIGAAFGGILLILPLIIGALLVVSEALKEILGKNSQAKTDLQYIWFAIKTGLKPAIDAVAEALQRALDFLIKILKYGMALANVLAGKNLFADATPEKFAKYMKEAEKSSKKTAKNAKEIKKQLAGFDEMNVLSDNSSKGGGGSSSNIGTPSFNLTDLGAEEQKIQEIKDKWKELLEVNRLEMYKTFMTDDPVWGVLKAGWFDTIQGIARLVVGFGETVKGVSQLLIGIFKGDSTLIKEGAKTLVTGLKDLALGLLQSLVGLMSTLLGAIWGVIATIGKWVYDNLIKPVASLISTKFSLFILHVKDIIGKAKKLIGDAVTWVKNSFSKVKDFIKDIFDKVVSFFSTTIDKIKETFKNIGEKAGEIVAGAFKAVVNGVLTAMEKILNAPINAINKLTDVINKVPGINLGKLNTFNLPRLATGGIINLPGRGVAIGGEAGKEGVLPLTNEQAMAELGESIGKYVVINLTNITKLDSREIAREENRVRNENSFLTNR